MNREEELYAAALAVPAAERPAFLAQACGNDPALRSRVEALLTANDEADAFFSLPTVHRPAVLVHEKPGDRIGRYKLLQKIGEGGCGVVYMAEQEEPVRRRVALKVIKLGMDTAAVIARFEAERQALALMDHPNITRVLDAGATDSGRPYFVMELVRGIPITRYCDEENLSTAQRLLLFVQVCHALQHAHQKGIIHRDIKPTNILVTMHDDVAVPKVIDFGIAKATQGRLTDKTVFTAFEQFMGTPAYMSPEQAQFNDLDVDSRSDIYSLGVLLYELLTGRPPFDPKTLRQCGIDEIRRIIREVEPPRPSAQLSTLSENDRAAIAKRHGTAPTQLTTLMSGDLDWIVMRAMEKNRTRRYDSANSLAADIKRHLSHEPVVARPPSVAYRLEKFATRNRYPLIGTAAAVVSLAAGLTLAKFAFRVDPSLAPSGSNSPRSPAEGSALRKLPLAEASWVMAVSPDGRYCAYMDQEWSPIFMYETATGKSWEIVKESTGGTWNVVFSPDGNQIAYELSDTVWLAKVDGSDLRQLYTFDKKKGSIFPVAWSAATGQVLASIRDPSKNLRTLVSLDPKTREMKELMPPTANSDYSLSADGRHLVLRSGGSATVLDLVSRKEAPFLDGHVKSLNGWSLNDSEFLFSSDRTGTNSLWTIAVKSGQPWGEPRFVKEYADRAGVSGVTRDGRIFYTEQRNSGNVFVVSASFFTGEVMGQPQLVTDRFPGVQSTPAWSGDGRKLSVAIEGRQRRFVTVSVDSGKQQDFPIATVFDRVRKYSWSKDGSFLLVAARKLVGTSGPTGIHRFDPASGKVETLVVKSGDEWLAHPRLSPDEKSFYYARRKYSTAADGSRNWSDFIVRRDFHSNREEVVYQNAADVQMWAPFELSPDGSRLALVTTDQGKKTDFVVALKVLTLGSGELKEVTRLAPREAVNSLAWTPDGTRLVYVRQTPNPDKKASWQSTIWSTVVDSGASVKLRLLQSDLGDIALNPDGKQLSFQTGSVGDTLDVWVMEGVIPKQVPEKSGTPPNVLAQRPKVIAASRSAAIPVDEVFGLNNSALDRTTGFGAVIPSGWKGMSASRGSQIGGADGCVLHCSNAEFPEAMLLLSYSLGHDGKSVPASEADAWLRGWVEGTLVEHRASMSSIANYKYRPMSLAPRVLNGRTAVTWAGDFIRGGGNWTEYGAVIHGEKGFAFVRLLGPTTIIETLRPASESLLESVRVP